MSDSDVKRMYDIGKIMENAWLKRVFDG